MEIAAEGVTMTSATGAESMAELELSEE